MGVWGPNSDQNDTVADDRIDVKMANGLYADANELVPLEVQALSDAKDAALLSEDVAYGHFGTIVGLVREGYALCTNAPDHPRSSCPRMGTPWARAADKLRQPTS